MKKKKRLSEKSNFYQAENKDVSAEIKEPVKERRLQNPVMKNALLKALGDK